MTRHSDIMQLLLFILHEASNGADLHLISQRTFADRGMKGVHRSCTALSTLIMSASLNG